MGDHTSHWCDSGCYKIEPLRQPLLVIVTLTPEKPSTEVKRVITLEVNDSYVYTPPTGWKVQNITIGN